MKQSRHCKPAQSTVDENGDDGEADARYYHLTTKAPDVRSIDSLIDRVFGNPGTMDAIDFLLDKLRNTKSNGEFFESMNT